MDFIYNSIQVSTVPRFRFGSVMKLFNVRNLFWNNTITSRYSHYFAYITNNFIKYKNELYCTVSPCKFQNPFHTFKPMNKTVKNAIVHLTVFSLRLIEKVTVFPIEFSRSKLHIIQLETLTLY